MYECLLSIEVTEPTGSWFTLSASLMFTMRPYFTDLCAFYFFFFGEKNPDFVLVCTGCCASFCICITLIILSYTELWNAFPSKLIRLF